MTDVTSDAIPDALKEREQWVCWREEPRDGKPTKVPVQPSTGRKAKPNDPTTWGTYTDALAAHQTGELDTDGIGYVFSSDGPIAGVDLDDCRDPDTGEIDPWAAEIVESLDSFTEASPTGTGLHVLAFGSIPDCGNRSGNVEMYDTTQFFTVTGHHVPDTPTDVRNAADALAAVHEEYVGGQQSASESRESTSAPQVSSSSDQPDTYLSGRGNSLSDSAVIAKAKAASNGSKFRRLWNGRTAGYPSHSEARLALLNFLACWTAGDREQMDRLYRKSGLHPHPKKPGKWERVGPMDISKAVRGCDYWYIPAEDSPFVDTDGPGMATADGGRNRFSVWLLHLAFDCLSEHGPTGTADIADRIDYSDRHTLDALDHLDSGGWIEYEKDGSGGYWTVVMEP